MKCKKKGLASGEKTYLYLFVFENRLRTYYYYGILYIWAYENNNGTTGIIANSCSSFTHTLICIYQYSCSKHFLCGKGSLACARPLIFYCRWIFLWICENSWIQPKWLWSYFVTLLCNFASTITPLFLFRFLFILFIRYCFRLDVSVEPRYMYMMLKNSLS